MNQLAMVRMTLPLLAAAALAACDAAPSATPPLEGASIGGDFTLNGEDGKPVRWSDFDGQYRTVYFGFAFCPDVCPTDNQRAMAGLKLFEKTDPERAAKVQPLFISVDPKRDTPQVLTEFTDAFHSRLIGMTGTDEQIAKVTKDFAAFYSLGEVREGGGYDVEHSTITYLFGPNGKPLATLPTDQGAEAVAAELAKWVR